MKKSAADCRKVSRCAKVAWRKKEPLQECSDPKKMLTAEGIGCHTQECAQPCKSGMVQEQQTRKECTRANVVQEIQRGRTFRRIHQHEPEYSNGIRHRGVEEQIHLRKGRKTAKSIGGRGRHQPRLESMGNGNKVFRKTTGMEFVKRENWTSSGLQRIKDCILWRGSTPSKTKKKKHREEEPVRLKHRPPSLQKEETRLYWVPLGTTCSGSDWRLNTMKGEKKRKRKEQSESRKVTSRAGTSKRQGTVIHR
jgi:hypothetical protein